MSFYSRHLRLFIPIYVMDCADQVAHVFSSGIFHHNDKQVAEYRFLASTILFVLLHFNSPCVASRLVQPRGVRKTSEGVNYRAVALASNLGELSCRSSLLASSRTSRAPPLSNTASSPP